MLLDSQHKEAQKLLGPLIRFYLMQHTLYFMCMATNEYIDRSIEYEDEEMKMKDNYGSSRGGVWLLFVRLAKHKPNQNLP